MKRDTKKMVGAGTDGGWVYASIRGRNWGFVFWGREVGGEVDEGEKEF